MITETGEVADTLRQVRQLSGNDKVDLAELIVLGGREKVEQLLRPGGDTERLALRRRFLARTRSGEGIDWEALAEVRHSGWSRR